MSATLPVFPGRSAPHLRAPARLRDQGFALRRAQSGDFPFLRRLYGQTRQAELAMVDWPEAACERFLDDQFALQHRHYVQQFADADFLIISRHGQPVGRLYLGMPPDARIIDIALLDNVRGQGIGGALVAAVQVVAAGQGSSVGLHVDIRNVAARRLYQRLGFVVCSPEGAYLEMRWSAPSVHSNAAS